MKRLFIGFVLTTIFLAPPLARADYDPIGSGSTRIALDPGFVSALAHAGVELKAIAPARLSHGTLSFPAVAGKFDPVAAKGTVEHEGTLLFQAGRRRVPLKLLKLRTTQKHSPFSAKVGGSQLKIATAGGIRILREGFDSRVRVSRLALSGKLAVRLGKKLDRRELFKPGLPLGSASTVAVPEETTVLGTGSSTLSFDPAFIAKLESLHVALNPIFPAEHQGSVFQLPIFGGDLAPDASEGRIETSGSIEFLQLEGGQVFWKNLWTDFDTGALSAELDVEPSPPYSGKVGRAACAAMASAIPASSDPSRRTIAVPSIPLSLEPATAATFNEVFSTPVGSPPIFSANETVGTLSFAARGQ